MKQSVCRVHHADEGEAELPRTSAPTVPTTRNSTARCKGSGNSLPWRRWLRHKSQSYAPADGGGPNAQGNCNTIRGQAGFLEPFLEEEEIGLRTTLQFLITIWQVFFPGPDQMPFSVCCLYSSQESLWANDFFPFMYAQ